jgi:hypothetical protein
MFSITEPAAFRTVAGARRLHVESDKITFVGRAIGTLIVAVLAVAFVWGGVLPALGYG